MKPGLLLLLALPVVAFAQQTEKQVRHQLQANYTFFSQAWKKKDLEPTYKYMTDDFTALGMDRSGKAIDRAQMIEQTKQLLKADHISWPRRILSVKVSDAFAVAVVEGHFTGMMPDDKGGQPHKFELIAKTKDTWVLMGGEWKFKETEIVSSEMKMDGKALKA